DRLGASVRQIALAQTALATSGFALFNVLFPNYASRLYMGLGILTESKAVGEAQSIFGGGINFLLTPFFLFGFGFVLFVALLVWLTWLGFKRLGEGSFNSGIIVLLSYSWYFLALSLLQRRFMGQLSVFATVLVGWGFVSLLSRLELARPVSNNVAALSRSSPSSNTSDGSSDGVQNSSRLTKPEPLDGSKVALVLLVFVLIAGIGIAEIPLLLGGMTIDPDLHDTARWAQGFSEEQNVEQEYVFSWWDRNRMLNYFVNGDSRSYRYAYRNYFEFLNSSSYAKWYTRISGRTGFVVTQEEPIIGDLPPDSMHSLLH
ncbi:MAG: hypothetical protein SV760_03800, partial [Halobacteria archaeon]|nr:hypothetical protein [Halobacteria archaeon]